MEPFVAKVEEFAAGKTIGLFGSYGWYVTSFHSRNPFHNSPVSEMLF